MISDQNMELLLKQLPQRDPSAELDHSIIHAVEKQLALENYFRAENLLNEQQGKLDAVTTLQLEAAMSGLRDNYGNGFQQAYSAFVAQQNPLQISAESVDVGLGRG